MKQYDDETIQKAKQWIGGDEVSVDVMIRAGVIELEVIMQMYQEEVLNK